MNRDDIELGEEIEDFPSRPRTGTVVSVRLSLDEAEALHKLAEQRRTTLSQIAREAIAAHLARRHIAEPGVMVSIGTSAVGVTALYKTNRTTYAQGTRGGMTAVAHRGG